MNGKRNEPRRSPKPEYSKCNAGHELTEVYDERYHAYVWDCNICIQKQKEIMQRKWDCAVCGESVFLLTNNEMVCNCGKVTLTIVNTENFKEI